MKNTPLRFEHFTPITAEASRLAWISDAKQGLAFEPESQRLFDWVDTHQEISATDAVAFGVFLGTSNEALGICEVTIQRQSAKSKWVKMLRLHLKPSIDKSLQDGDPDMATIIFVRSMQGAIELQMTHAATKLKVYGRTNEQLNFLKVLVTHLEPTLRGKPVTAAIENRFLTITTS